MTPGSALAGWPFATSVEWMALHLECLYTADPRGRIERNRAPGGPRAPRFHLGRTPHGNIWRFRDDTPDGTIRTLARLAAREAPLRAGEAPPARNEAIRRCLALDAEVASEYRGPAYFFPLSVPSALERVEPTGPGAEGDADVVVLGVADREVLEPDFTWLARELEARGPCAAALVGGRAVSVCCCARLVEWPEATGDTPRLVAEASLETAPSHRRQGYATRVAARWAEAVREMGGIALYSTSWENPGSRAVARRLGLVWYGEDLHLT